VACSSDVLNPWICVVVGFGCSQSLRGWSDILDVVVAVVAVVVMVEG